MSAPEGNTASKLIPMAYAVAAMAICAGVYLLHPVPIGLSVELRPEKTALAGVLLIWSGITLVVAPLRWSLQSGSDLANVPVNLLLGLFAGQFTLLGLGGIEAIIGGKALLASPPNLWVGALLVPGLISLGLGFALDVEETKEKIAQNKAEADAPTTSQSGQVRFGISALAGIVYAAIYVVYIFLAIGAIVLLFWLYYRLDGTIFGDETFDFANAGWIFWDLGKRIFIAALPAVIVAPVAIFAITMIAALFQWLSHRGTPDPERDLTPAEVSYIDRSAEAVVAYVKAQGYDRTALIGTAVGLASVFGMIGLGAVAMFWGIAWLEAVPARASLPIALNGGGASMIVGFFAFILLGTLPNSILSRLSRRHSEQAGSSIGVKNNYLTLKGRLTALVRARRLSTAVPINAGEFLHATNLSFEPYFLFPAAVVAAFALFLLHRDLNSADQLTADHIEVVDYWTLAHHRYAYSDVKRVKVLCFLTDKGEPAETYELLFKDGRALDIHKDKNFAVQLGAYEEVDAKLRAQGVVFEPGANRAWFKGDERGYDPACVDKVAEGLSEKDRARVRRFFHVAEFESVEDVWPWDDELAAARYAGEAYDVAKSVELYGHAIASGRLKGHLLAVAYRGRGLTRDDYETSFGIRDSEMLLALRDYQKAREIEPSVNAYREEGSALIALGAYAEATTAFRKALDLDMPDPHWSLIGLARVERIQGHYDAAMAYLDQVLRVWGENDASMPIFYHRARVLALKHDDAGVVDAITKGLTYQKDYADAYRVRGCAYARLGAFAKAKADIARAVELVHEPPRLAVWSTTPSHRAYDSELASDNAIVGAMEAGTATDSDRAKLCEETWNYGEWPRERSALLGK